MRRVIVALCTSVVLVPTVTHAAVLINEIAWMGTASSANDEWIELYNNSTSDVDLSGWVLTGSGGVEVILSGTALAGSYAVLERTDDSSAPGSAFLIYTGALSNTGETLTLRHADNSIEDQIAGGENWENIGGDNTTKETSQRTNAGWVTAGATPGGVNMEESSTVKVENPDSSPNTETVTVSKSLGTSSDDDKIELVKSLTIHGPKQAYVNQPVDFDVSPSGSQDRLIRYLWTFGDGEASEEKTPIHTYAYPGNYVIMVESHYAKQTVLARRELVVLPSTFSITRASNNDIQVNNDAKYEIDISGFQLVGISNFIFPEHTILLAGATLTIPREKIERGIRQVVSLTDPAGIIVALHNPYMVTDDNSFVSAEPVSVSESRVQVLGTSTSRTLDFEVPEKPMVLKSEAQNMMVDTVQSEKLVVSDNFAYLGLIGILLLGTVGVFIRKSTQD